MAADTAPRPAASKSAPMTAGLYNDGSVFQRGMNEVRERRERVWRASRRISSPLHPSGWAEARQLPAASTWVGRPEKVASSGVLKRGMSSRNSGRAGVPARLTNKID